MWNEWIYSNSVCVCVCVCVWLTDDIACDECHHFRCGLMLSLSGQLQYWQNTLKQLGLHLGGHIIAVWIQEVPIATDMHRNTLQANSESNTANECDNSINSYSLSVNVLTESIKRFLQGLITALSVMWHMASANQQVLNPTKFHGNSEIQRNGQYSAAQLKIPKKLWL